MQEIHDDNFAQLVLASDKPVLVEFGAAWCVPCSNLLRILTELEESYGVGVTFYKMDVDNAPNTSSEYSIRSVPTILFFKRGAVMDCLLGVQNKQKIIGVLQKIS